jgi:hypothetical protein
MGVCTGISALQLAAIRASFLLAVLCLDMFWVTSSSIATGRGRPLRRHQIREKPGPRREGGARLLDSYSWSWPLRALGREAAIFNRLE